MKKEKKIVASIIANSQKELERRINNVKNDVDKIQLDIMDGRFVAEKSLFFNFVLPKINIEYEAHLMVNEPEDWISELGERVNTIIIHYESSKNIEKLINLIRKRGKKVGLAISPKTKIFEINKYFDSVDQILIFTADKMGFYGAKFSKNALEKIDIIAKTKDVLIEVDGGISIDNINEVSKKGANLFVCGSVLQKSIDIKETVMELRKLV
jgi:ribulose-phosphate 3-epimerase